MLKAFKYRLYPTSSQEILLNKTFGCVRYLWNQKVADFRNSTKDIPIISKTSTELRNSIEWMREVSAAAIQQKEIDFKVFKKNRFNKARAKKIGDPQFKKRGMRQSYRLPNQKFSIENNKLRLEKIGRISYVCDRALPNDAKLMSVTISKNTVNQYFASVLFECEIKQIEKTGLSIGVDVCLKEFATLSDGTVINNPRYFRENQAKLKKAQRRLARKKKGSSRYKKCKLKVARIHLKSANQRQWFHQHYSTQLIKNYDIICIEDLNVSGMIKNRKLAKSLSDVGFSGFFSLLDYKAAWYGKQVVRIPRFYPSSKTCSCCGYKKETLKLSERIFVCESCSNSMDRDFNAALNIQAVGVSIAQSDAEKLSVISSNACFVEAPKVKSVNSNLR